MTYNLPTGTTPNTTITATLTVTDSDGCVNTSSDAFVLLAAPSVTLSHTDPGCGANDGTITVSFPDQPDRTGIEFSIDGGATWPTSASVSDASGSYTFVGLSPGTYDVRARWGDNSCPVEVGIVTLDPYTDITDAGSIDGGDSQCGSYDPPMIQSTSPASGGLGPAIVYRWQYRQWDCASASYGDWTWVPGNSNTDTYDPGIISTTTQYRRRANRQGCPSWDDSNLVTFEVYENGDPGTIGVDQEYCVSGDPPAFTSTPAGGGCYGSPQYQWQYRVGVSGTWVDLVGETNETRDPGALSQTQQYRRLVRWNTLCPWVASNIVTITIQDLPTVTISSTQDNPCFNQNVTLTATGNGGSGSGYTYTWSSGLGSGNSHTIVADTTTTFFVTITDSNGCTATGQHTITVRDIITNFGSISANQQNCGPFDPDPIIGTPITTSGPNISPTYQWEILDNGTWVNISGATNKDYDPPMITETTSYRRRAYMMNGCGNAPTNVVTMIVYDGVSAQISGDTSTCVNEIINLTLNVSGSTNYSILWSHNLGTNHVVSVSPTTTTTYYAVVTSEGSCKDTAYFTVSVYDLPSVQIVASDSIICEDAIFVLDAIANGQQPLTYQWNTGQNTAQINVNGTSIDRFLVTVTDANGCVDIDTFDLMVTQVIIDNVVLTSGMDCDDNCTGSFYVVTDYQTVGEYQVSYTYQNSLVTIGPFFQDTAYIYGLCAGSYTDITVSSTSTGCEKLWTQGNININQTSVSWEHVTKVDDVSNCNQSCDGSFIVDANYASSGQFSFSYTYQGIVYTEGPFNFAGDIVVDNLCAGIYSEITITSLSSGCSNIWPTDIEILEPEPVATVTSFVDDDCQAGEGTATVNVSGGTAPYTITWTSADGSITGSGIKNVAGNYVITGLEGGHEYCITILDSNGCSYGD